MKKFKVEKSLQHPLARIGLPEYRRLPQTYRRLDSGLGGDYVDVESFSG